jgi:hypothetical protein
MEDYGETLFLCCFTLLGSLCTEGLVRFLMLGTEIVTGPSPLRTDCGWQFFKQKQLRGLGAAADDFG